MRSELIKGLLVTSLGVALVAGAILTRPAAAQDNLPDGPGKDVVMASCNNCHDVSQVTGEHQTKEQWASTVTSMINNGATVSDAQFDTLVAYLAANFGPEGQTPAPAAATPPVDGTAPTPAAAAPASPDAGSTPATPAPGAAMPPANGAASAPAAQ